MYGYDSKFLAEVSRVANTLLEEILSYLKTIEKAEVGKQYFLLNMKFFCLLHISKQAKKLYTNNTCALKNQNVSNVLYYCFVIESFTFSHRRSSKWIWISIVDFWILFSHLSDLNMQDALNS